ncbi:MAG: rhodanese-like domain-containing protein [Sulfuricurvum sp.]|nr:rhodanese-like domain-containing protein [Sulfuricurvum sp.]
MKKIIVLCVLAAANLLGWNALQSTAQVASQLNDPKVIIVDVSESETYKKEGHIHGALHTDIGAWRSAHEKHFLLKTPDEIQKHMRSLGINTDSNVILYGHLGSAKDLLHSTYIYWAMKHYGTRNVAIMDGGLEQWKSEKRFVLNDEVRAPEGNFTVQVAPEMVVDLPYVKQNIGKIPMIDARPAEIYFGVTSSNGVERLGHIPGAMSYFWTYSITPELKVKSRETLKKIFSEGFGLKQNQEIIVYCTGGLETSFNYFVLSGILGYTHMRLYDGSMREWGNRQETPMVQYRWEEFHPLVEVIK